MKTPKELYVENQLNFMNKNISEFGELMYRQGTVDAMVKIKKFIESHDDVTVDILLEGINLHLTYNTEKYPTTSGSNEEK